MFGQNIQSSSKTSSRRSVVQHYKRGGGSVNYDNCIVTAHDDSSDNSSEMFDSCSKHVEDREDISSDFDQQQTEDEECDDEDCHLSMEDLFVLLLGMLDKVEKHMISNEKIDGKTEELVGEVQLVKKALINRCKYFGCNTVVSEDNVLYVSDLSSNKKKCDSRILTNGILQEPDHATAEANTQTENTSTTNPENSQSQLKLNPAKMKQKLRKRDSNGKIFTSTPNLQTEKNRDKKRKKSADADSERHSQGKKIAKMELRSLGQIKNEAQALSRSTGEDFDIVYYKLKKEAGFYTPLPRKCRNPRGNRDETSSQDVTNVDKPSSSRQKKDPKKKAKNAKSRSRISRPTPKTKKPKTIKANNLSAPQILTTNADLTRNNSMNGSCKRKLYSPKVWLEKLNKTYCP